VLVLEAAKVFAVNRVDVVIATARMAMIDNVFECMYIVASILKI
jgi:hypothetical protein